METRIFDYYPPKSPYIGILSIPHSGETVPDDFKEFLVSDLEVLSRDVDTGVDRLVDIEELNQAGVAVLKANIHRACVDLNRPPEAAPLNWKRNSRGELLVEKTPEAQQLALFAQKYHAPYYEMIKALMSELGKSAERPSFIDLHSMPSRPTGYHLKINPNQAMERPDFCLSDIEGLSCAPEFINHACSELARDYSRVTQNDPYFGGHITRHTHEQWPHCNNIQIEIKRGIYMFEEKRELDPDKVQKLRPILTQALIKTFQAFAPPTKD